MIFALCCALLMDDVSVFPSGSMPRLKVPESWKRGWDTLHGQRPPLAVATRPDMSPLFNGLDRMVKEQVQQLDTLWLRISEIVGSPRGCPQHVADDLLERFRDIVAYMWAIDRIVSRLKKTITSQWEDPRFPEPAAAAVGDQELSAIVPQDLSVTGGIVSCRRIPIVPQDPSATGDTTELPLSRKAPHQCTGCAMHHRRPVADYVHVHHRKDGICATASFWGDNRSYLSFTKPSREISHPVISPVTLRKHAALFSAIQEGITTAFAKVLVPPPASLAHRPGVSETFRIIAVQRLPMERHLGRQFTEQPPWRGAGADLAFGHLACDHSHLETDSWVHVHLPAYGLCWTFDWEPEYRRPVSSRVGPGSVWERHNLRPQRELRLRTALERWIHNELNRFYIDWDLEESANAHPMDAGGENRLTRRRHSL